MAISLIVICVLLMVYKLLGLWWAVGALGVWAASLIFLDWADNRHLYGRSKR